MTKLCWSNSSMKHIFYLFIYFFCYLQNIFLHINVRGLQENNIQTRNVVIVTKSVFHSVVNRLIASGNFKQSPPWSTCDTCQYPEVCE